MNTMSKTDNIYDIISTIAMCASDDSIDNVERIKYCYDKILHLTNNKDVAQHAADCIAAIISSKEDTITL